MEYPARRVFKQSKVRLTSSLSPIGKQVRKNCIKSCSAKKMFTITSAQFYRAG